MMERVSWQILTYGTILFLVLFVGDVTCQNMCVIVNAGNPPGGCNQRNQLTMTVSKQRYEPGVPLAIDITHAGGMIQLAPQQALMLTDPLCGRVDAVNNIERFGPLPCQAPEQMMAGLRSDGGALQFPTRFMWTPPNNKNRPVTLRFLMNLGGDQLCVQLVIEPNMDPVMNQDSCQLINLLGKLVPQNTTHGKLNYGLPHCRDTEDGQLPVRCFPPPGAIVPLAGIPIQLSCCCEDDCGAPDCCLPRPSIINIGNNAPPVINQPSCNAINQRGRYVPKNTTHVKVFYGLPECSDTEELAVVATCDPMPGDCVPSPNGGIIPITCTCVDVCQQRDICNPFIFRAPAANVPPVLQCGAVNDARIIPQGLTRAEVQFTLPTCTDQEDGPLLVICTPMPGDVVRINGCAGGNVCITCYCSDSCEVRDTCKINIPFPAANNQPPRIDPDKCRGSEGGLTPFQPDSAIFEIDPTVCTDDEEGFLTLACSTTVDFCTGGVRTVSCTCTDSCGLEDTCGFLEDVPSLMDDRFDPGSGCPDGATRRDTENGFTCHARISTTCAQTSQCP